ncbi:helix-turn-helix domain-containing protein [Plantactinospora solaniradicis]|uniref:Helix-turn-helix domain-containing protein n=1 Tax=Plantactinospora solaniradicis TaxID=1723736 RepID=A0ABW1KLZ0_9ACTN
MQRFAAQLRRLREEAGRPGYRELARRAHFAPATLSEAAAGRRFPTLPVTLAYVEACGGDRTVWEARWKAATAALEEVQPEPAGEPVGGGRLRPYRGLAAYQPEDAEWFFGRERLVGDVLARLGRRRFLAVFGPSGSGKSSLLRAGLLPAVRDGQLSDGQKWPAILMTPGDHPLAELAARLARQAGISAGAVLDDLRVDPSRAHLILRQALAGDPDRVELLLLVDQFEELFLLCQDVDERTAFVTALLALAFDQGSRARVVLGVRADFYARCADYPALVEALTDSQVLVGPMTAVEVRDAVTKPAEHAGLKVESALVAIIVAEVAGRVGVLPVASHALLEAWRRRRGSIVTLAGYEAAGGVEGALTQTVERVYDDFDESQRRRLREMLLRMVEVGADGEVARRRVELSELGDELSRDHLLDRLAAARLVTVQDRSVEIAHEALLSAWPRLREWLDEDRDGLRLHRQLTQAAATWVSLNRDAGALYRGLRLSLAMQWTNRTRVMLSPIERRFLEASRIAGLRAGRRRQRRMWTATASLVSVLVVFSVLAGAAVGQAEQAEDGRDLASSRRLAATARAQLDLDHELALLLAREAYAVKPTPEAEVVLRQATLVARSTRVWMMRDRNVGGLAFSPDGQRLVTTGGSEVQVRNVRNLAESTTLASSLWESAPIVDAALVPGGQRMTVATGDGRLLLVDLVNPFGPVTLAQRTSPGLALAISPDGRRFGVGGPDGTVRISGTVERGDTVVLRGTTELAHKIVFSPYGGRVAVSGADGSVRVWDTNRPDIPTALPGDSPVTDVAFSSDGRLAVADSTGRVRIWDPAAARALVSFTAHPAVATTVAFSPDGGWIATGGDRAARIWDSTNATHSATLRGHRGRISNVVFSPDGKSLASVSTDGTGRLWDLTEVAPVILRAHRGPSVGAVFGPDSRTVISAGRDATLRRWSPGRSAPEIIGTHDRPFVAFAAQFGGRRVATLDSTGAAHTWDLKTVVRHFAQKCDDAGVRDSYDMAISRDGIRLALNCNTRLRVLNTSAPTGPRVLEPVSLAAFSPDGTMLAVWGFGPVLWADAANGRLRRLGAHQNVSALTISPDGRLVASASENGSLHIWPIDGSGGRIPTRPLEQPGAVRHLAFSPDGNWLASAADDGVIRLWSVADPSEPLVFDTATPPANSLHFSPDGRRLITTHEDGTVRIVECRVCGPIDDVLATAKERVARELTPEERYIFLSRQSGGEPR